MPPFSRASHASQSIVPKFPFIESELVDTMIEVTFSDFAKLATKRKLTPECLAQRFAGKIDRPGEFFDRVFKSQYAAVVIPYRSVLAFYSSELKCHQDAVGRIRVCACGCEQPVFDRQKWASPGCRQRAARRRMAA
jgi:hypothetical protein